MGVSRAVGSGLSSGEAARNSAGDPADPPRSPGFVGRRAQLELLRSELSRAFAGQARIVVVEGDGGIGKTSLVEETVGHLPDALVVRASGEQSEAALAWSMVTQLLAGIERRQELSAAASPVGGADPLAVGAGIAARIEEVATTAPVVVFLDDLHWCDPLSAVALLFALRRLDAAPVLTVAAARPPFPGELGEGWRRLVSSRGRVVRLGGMDSDELGGLAHSLGRPVSERAAARVWRHTGGHPLWAAALFEELGVDELEAGEETLPVPRDLAGTIRARHGALGRSARALVAAGSVLGERFSAALVAALAGVEDPAPSLQQAIDAGLLRETHAGTTAPAMFGFTHPVVRFAIYQDLGPARRSQLHGEAARLTSGTEALGHLAAAALAPSEAVAAELEAAGAAEFVQGRLPFAQLHLDASVRLSLPGLHRQRRVLEAIEAHLWAGEPERSQVYSDEAAAADPGPYRDYVLGCLARSKGRFAETHALLQGAWSSLGAGLDSSRSTTQPGSSSSSLVAKVAVTLAALAVLRMAPDDAVTFARAALAADASAPTGHLARAVELVALGLGGAGSEALRLVGTAPAEGIEVHELVGRGIVRLWTDDLSGAHRDLSVAVARTQAGEALRLMQPLAFLADASFRLCRMADASAHAELACDIVDAAGRRADLVIVHTRAGYAAAATGDFTRAQAHAAAIASLAGRIGTHDSALARVRASVGAASGVAAAVALAQDDPEALLGAAQAATALTAASEPGAFALGPVLAEALVGLGRLDEAETALAAYEQRAAAVGRRSALAGAARVRGTLCAATDDHHGARRSFDAALAHAHGLPFELGRCHHSYGKALAAAGNTNLAHTQLAAARAIFADGGALAFVQLVDADLTHLGPVIPTGPDAALTAGEQAVARLAAQRLTNPEIAEKLTVSRKTVEYHLSNVYAKLGIRSRTQLTQLLEHAPGMRPD